MKQRISNKQLAELSGRGMKKYREYLRITNLSKKPSGSHVNGRLLYRVVRGIGKGTTERVLPLLSIGQMIEFLSDSFKEKTNVFDLPSIREGKVDQHAICDFLWGAVKEVLEK